MLLALICHQQQIIDSCQTNECSEIGWKSNILGLKSSNCQKNNMLQGTQKNWFMKTFTLQQQYSRITLTLKAYTMNSHYNSSFSVDVNGINVIDSEILNNDKTDTISCNNKKFTSQILSGSFESNSKKIRVRIYSNSQFGFSDLTINGCNQTEGDCENKKSKSVNFTQTSLKRSRRSRRGRDKKNSRATKTKHSKGGRRSKRKQRKSRSGRSKIIKQDKPQVLPPKRTKQVKPQVFPPKRIKQIQPQVLPPKRIKQVQPQVLPPKRIKQIQPQVFPPKRIKQVKPQVLDLTWYKNKYTNKMMRRNTIILFKKCNFKGEYLAIREGKEFENLKVKNFELQDVRSIYIHKHSEYYLKLFSSQGFTGKLYKYLKSEKCLNKNTFTKTLFLQKKMTAHVQKLQRLSKQ